MYTKSLLVLLSILVFASGCAPNRHARETGIADRYIVVYRKGVTAQSLAAGIASDVQPPERVFTHALNGGVYHLSEEQARLLAAHSDVAYVEKDQEMHISSTQSNPTWGLDRLDQSSLPLDHSYTSPDGGAQVNAYIIDTGILTSHQEFEGRASSGADLVDNDSDATDCNGHGTHVAGTIGSKTYGVAKNVKLIAVRVLDCDGSGSISSVVAGIEWVTAHHVAPAVANMSLGGGASQAIDDALNASIQSGVTYAVAAGNDNLDACSGSPARVPAAITVGASTNADARASFSDTGSCVDLFAPGLDITSTWFSSVSATNTISGTSMATPHVVGVAALYLAQHPNASPAEVSAALVANATSGKLSGVGNGSPNKLLNIAFLNGGSVTPPPVNPPPVTPPPQDSKLKNGQAVSAISGAQDEEKSFSIDVPQGASNLVIEISGGSGDADLYVKAGSKPSTSSYDCRPYKSGNNESCTIASPAQGTYYLSLRAYSSFSGVTLKVSYSTGGSGGGGVSGAIHESGSLSAAKDSKYSAEYQSASGAQKIALAGPANSDFDLYLYQKNSSGTWIQVASSLKTGVQENLSYTGTSGTYRVKVYAYAGKGAYDLTINPAQ